MVENQLNAGNIIDIFLKVCYIVDSGNPDDYQDFIKAVSLAIFEVTQTQGRREEFARKYGEQALNELLSP